MCGGGKESLKGDNGSRLPRSLSGACLLGPIQLRDRLGEETAWLYLTNRLQEISIDTPEFHWPARLGQQENRGQDAQDASKAAADPAFHVSRLTFYGSWERPGKKTHHARGEQPDSGWDRDRGRGGIHAPGQGVILGEIAGLICRHPHFVAISQQ